MPVVGYPLHYPTHVPVFSPSQIADVIMAIVVIAVPFIHRDTREDIHKSEQERRYSRR